MKVLVTGGAGYVGSVVVGELLSRGHQVRVLDVLRRGGNGLVGYCSNPNFDFTFGDVGEPDIAARAVDGVDAVIHLAALVGYPSCNREPGLARLTNVTATETLLSVLRPGQRFVFASTVSVYGAVLDGVCTEATPPTPVSLYGETKVESERLVGAVADAVTLRFATVYGVSPAMRDDLLINNFVHEAVQRGVLVVYEPHVRRPFLHVRDAARSLAFVLDEWQYFRGGVFNVGDEELSVTKKEICERLMSLVDCHIEYADFAEDLDRRYYAVSFEALRKTGFQVTIPFDAAIRELIMAYRLRVA